MPVNYLTVAFITASLIFLTLFSSSIIAQSPSDILINEFSIEPEQMVELYNSSQEIVDISGWYIDDSGGTTFFTVPTDTFLNPNSCVVLQKNFNLNKLSADTIRLFDNSAIPTNQTSQLIDSYSYSSSPGNEISYLRNPDGTDIWTSARSSFGFFNETGADCLVLPTETPTPATSPTATQASTTTPSPSPSTSQSFDNIYISEVMIAPEAGEREWVELYNDNDFQVTLSDWYIDDIESGGSSSKKISITIRSKMYATIELSSAIFNNSGDSVRLLDQEENEKDSFTYSSSKKGKSWGWSELKGNNFCLQTPSRNSLNTVCTLDQASSVSNTIDGKTTTYSSTTSISPSQINRSQPSNSTYRSYAVAVTPPVIISNSNNIGHEVLSATSEYVPPQKSLGNLPLLAASYSLLSIGSLAVKMIYS